MQNRKLILKQDSAVISLPASNLKRVLVLILAFFHITLQHTHSDSPESSSIPIINEANLIDLTYQALECPSLNYQAFCNAYKGFQQFNDQSVLSNDSILTIIDFEKSSKEERFFVINLKQKKVVMHTWVAHGKNTGMVYAERFSNIKNSLQSSLGFYLTKKTYYGKHGYSLRLAGLEKGINDKAWERAIVIHGADYVSQEFIRKHGRLGRSFGCPALSYELSEATINLIKDGSLLFIHHPSRQINAG
jgi:hypothetical protein